MPDLTETRTVLARSDGWPNGPDKPTFRVPLGAFEAGRSYTFILDRNVYEDMGRPGTITVTIEPGDTLNHPTPRATSEGHFFCGCCGREITQGTELWCMDCLREHVNTLAARPDDATFYAQHGTNCPFTDDDGRLALAALVGALLRQYPSWELTASPELKEAMAIAERAAK